MIKQKNKILKFDGIDGCGKSSLIESCLFALSKSYKSIQVKEFGNEYDVKIAEDEQGRSLSQMIRHFVTTDSYMLDDIEREVLWTVISRRTNRLVMPKLMGEYDYILVDRSEIGNYCYGLTINPSFQPIYDICLNFPSDGLIFWIDTPPEVAIKRIEDRKLPLSYNEKKGVGFLKLVREKYLRMSLDNPRIIRLDGEKTVTELTIEVMNLINS